jgi:hypothetical protein
MCSIDLFPRRSRQTLHTVIAATEQNCAEDVDQDMEPGIDVLDAPTIPFLQKPFILPVGDGTPNGDDQVDRENYHSPD